MIVPGRQAIAIAAVLALVLIGAVIDGRVALVVLVADLALLVSVWVSGRRLRALAIDLRREDGGRAQVGRVQDVAFRIANRSTEPLIVRLRQPWPVGVDAEGQMIEVAIGPGEVVRAALSMTPRERGAIDLPAGVCEVRRNRLDLARVRREIAPGRMRVFPSLRGLSAFEALRQHHAGALAGAHRHRMIGAGRDFDQLRDYVHDDDFRQINWKATARRNKPITTVYQAERSQDVLMCLDCGRTMGHRLGGGTALDHAIDASIMLSHVASREQDRVGLVLFKDVVTRFVKPAAGMAAVNRVIEDLADARPEPVFPAYAALMAALRTKQTRRAFVFLFTDLNDPQLAANLTEVLPLIVRKHAVTVIGLRDPLIDSIANGPAAGRRELYQAIAARRISNERATRVRELQKSGATVLEADAGSLSTRVLNAYLTAKSRQLV